MEQLKLNMIPNGVNPVFHASQYDKGRQIRFVLDETLSGAEVTTSYRAKDGTEHGNVQTSVSGNTITDTIPEEVLTDYGIIEGEVNIDGIGSLNFFVEVEKDAYDGGVITTQTATGAIATFETNIETAFVSLKSDINPVQDLHGYSKPWSGGGGKNKFSNVWSDYTKPNDYRICPITLTNGQTYKLSATLKGTAMTDRIVVAIVKDGTQYSNFVGFTQLINAQGEINTLSSFTIDNTWVNPKLAIYCSDEAQFNRIFANYNVQLEQGSTATAYEPYSNICPISGFSALNVTRTGVNVWNEAIEQGAYSNSGAKVSWAGAMRSVDIFPINPNTSYYFKFSGTVALYICWYDISGTFIERVVKTASQVITPPSNAYYCAFCTSNDYGTTYNNDISINYPSSDTEYHAYNGQTATVNFGQTVYGGVADVTNGKVNVTHGIVDLGALDWISEDSALSGLARVSQTQVIPLGAKYLQTPICTQFEGVYTKSYVNFNNGEIAFSNSEQLPMLRARSTEFIGKTNAQIKALMSGVMLVFELATPIEITTTPENLTAISGENNVYSDTNGDTEVKYYIEV